MANWSTMLDSIDSISSSPITNLKYTVIQFGSIQLLFLLFLLLLLLLLLLSVYFLFHVFSQHDTNSHYNNEPQTGNQIYIIIVDSNCALYFIHSCTLAHSVCISHYNVGIWMRAKLYRLASVISLHRTFNDIFYFSSYFFLPLSLILGVRDGFSYRNDICCCCCC